MLVSSFIVLEIRLCKWVLYGFEEFLVVDSCEAIFF